MQLASTNHTTARPDNGRTRQVRATLLMDGSRLAQVAAAKVSVKTLCRLLPSSPLAYWIALEVISGRIKSNRSAGGEETKKKHT